MGRIATTFGVWILGSTFVLAQSASNLTPETFEPERQRLTGQIVFSGAPGLTPPPGAERLSVQLAGVSVEGTLPGLENATDAFRTRLVGKRVAASEIFAAASDLEEAYANAGFVLVRVVLPQQTLRDGGNLRLTVVNGFVEDVQLTKVQDEILGRLEALTQSLVNQENLRLRQLERQLLLAGDTYGVALESALTTGTRPGGTIVVLEPTYKPVTGFLSIDNTAPEQIGSLKYDTGIELNGTLGFGEALYARGSFVPDGFDLAGLFSDDAPLRTISLGFALPIGANGLNLNGEVTQSVTNSVDSGNITASDFSRASLRLFYPVIRSRPMNLSVQASLDFQKDVQDLLPSGGGTVAVYEDQQTVLRLNADLTMQTDGGATFNTGVTYSRGLDWGGARTAAEAATTAVPLSRDGADAEFNKLELAARYQRPLGDRFWLKVNTRAQTSFGESLTAAEQIGIANAQEITGFGTGTLSGDSGIVGRIDVTMPQRRQFQGIPFSLNPYVFAGAGALKIENPTALEEEFTTVTSFGAGVELSTLQDDDFSTKTLRLEFGRGTRDDTNAEGTRLTVIGSIRF